MTEPQLPKPPPGPRSDANASRSAPSETSPAAPTSPIPAAKPRHGLSAAVMLTAGSLLHGEADLIGLRIDAERVSIGHGDNWANTWGLDDRLYAFFTDGHGFGREVAVSSAPVIIHGTPPEISGEDLYPWSGGVLPTLPDGQGGRATAKVSGLVMIDGILYAWTRNLNREGTPAGTGARLMYSRDRALSWHWVDWEWTHLGYPVWMNAGRNYEAAPDGYAYFISPDGPSAYADYDAIILGRVPVDQVLQEAAYRFFSGMDGEEPRWRSFDDRQPVLTDPMGCFRPSITYNPGLGQYLLVMCSPYGDWGWWDIENPRRQARLALYLATAPWGPWRLHHLEKDWGKPENRFAPSIPSKWISDDGRTFYLKYSAIPVGPYQFNVRKCELRAEPTPLVAPMPAP